MPGEGSAFSRCTRNCCAKQNRCGESSPGRCTRNGGAFPTVGRLWGWNFE
jgi:hypothetical protein